MRIIKRFAVVMSALALSVPAMLADDGVKLYIHLTSGEKMELAFADRPTISFNSKNALKIQSATMSMKVKAFSTVEKITFDELSGIGDVVSADRRINAESGRKVALLGFKAGTCVNVVGVNGVVCLSATVDNEDRFELSLDRLEKGVYIVSAEKEMCKLIIE